MPLDHRACSCGATAKIDGSGHTILQSHMTIESAKLTVRRTG